MKNSRQIAEIGINFAGVEHEIYLLTKEAQISENWMGNQAFGFSILGFEHEK